MGSADNFCLRWNEFETNISTSFRELRQTSEFFDVTLCCDNGSDTVQAHKVILAACSPLFRRILSHSTQQNPLIYLKGIQLKELQNVLNFMYHGEVNVAQDSLNKFLSVAEELAVKGLSTNDNLDNRVPPTSHSAAAAAAYYDDDDEEEEVVPASTTMTKRSSAKKTKRQASSSLSKRKGDGDLGGATIEVDLKRIKTDPDVGDGGGDDNGGEVYETVDDYEGLGQLDDDFDDSVAGGSGAGATGTDGKEMEEATFLRSQKGQPILMDTLGYLYCANRKTDTRIYWKCQCAKKKSCRGRAMTEGFFITKKSGGHTHQPYPGYATDKDV